MRTRSHRWLTMSRPRPPRADRRRLSSRTHPPRGNTPFAAVLSGTRKHSSTDGGRVVTVHSGRSWSGGEVEPDPGRVRAGVDAHQIAQVVDDEQTPPARGAVR